MNFNESLRIGKKAEDYAIQYFTKHKWKFVDVRNNTEYQKKDIDFIANGRTYEVKQNYHNAMKYRPGKYIWIELEVGDKSGWWYFCEADYFMFFNNEGNCLFIKNDSNFKNRINYLIENGDHSEYGLNRFDYKSDKRYRRYITAKSMRVYLEQIEDLITNKLVKRK